MAKKRKHVAVENTKTKKNGVELQPVRTSDEPPKKKTKWTNKERVLIFSSRGISYRDRHLMKDFKMSMPHSKSETKMDRKDKLPVINEIAEMKNCNKCIYFEAKKKKDLYMWVSNISSGPSAKFLVENVHTMRELKLTGNSLKGSRPLLSFDETFDQEPHWALLKEMFIQIFATPNHHPKSQPFVDHVYNFSIVDNRIWFRNYQIMEENAELAEIGPRMVLNPIRIFQGSFCGVTLYQNPSYISPNEVRRNLKRRAGMKYMDRVSQKKMRDTRHSDQVLVNTDPTDSVFDTH